MDAAKALLPKQTGAPDANVGMKVVETTSVEANRGRLNELHRRSGFDMGGGVILQDELTLRKGSSMMKSKTGWSV
jgi:hypothetical protein